MIKKRKEPRDSSSLEKRIMMELKTNAVPLDNDRSSLRAFMLIIIGFLIIVSCGLTYSYFVAQRVVGNNTNNTIVFVGNGDLIVNYDENFSSFNIEDLDLDDTTDGTTITKMLKFSIRNEQIPHSFIIKWNNLVNTFCKYRDDDYYCTDNPNDTNVWGELTYSLYECSSTNYSNITSPTDTDISNCNKISAQTDQSIPPSTSTEKLHTYNSISITANTVKYYVLQVKLVNLLTNQNYQMGKTLGGGLKIEIQDSPVVTIGDNSITFTSTDTLGYKMLTDEDVIKYTTPATTSKGAAFWIPTENEWKILVCDTSSSWYYNGYCKYCDSGNASYNATTCTYYYNYLTSKYVIGENGIFSVANANGTSYYYRGGEGCSILGNNITSTYNTAAACKSANGNWMTIGIGRIFNCFANGTPAACTNAGGTWSYLNNNVSFAGFNWKIVRINEDGSIRIALDGITSGVRKEGSASYAGLNARYSLEDEAGVPSSVNETAAINYASYDDSNLESVINLFYETYIDDSATLNTVNYSSYLADSTFCSDMTWYSQNAGQSWYFKNYNKVINAYAPTYECPNASAYKVTNSPGITLSHPIGTLSNDEMRYAGFIRYSNSSVYLHSSIYTTYWTMSPSQWLTSGRVYGTYIDSGGGINIGGTNLYSQLGVRPVLNLRSDVLTSGSGTVTDPYEILET